MREKKQLLTPEEAAERFVPLLDSGALVPVTVTGTSMVPFLRHQKDTAFLRGPQYLPPRVGDILFFRRDNGELVLHRLNQFEPDGRLRINGDAQTWFERIQPGQVLGVVELVRRGKGKPFSPRRFDWRLLQWLWRGLLPVRPELLRLFGILRPGRGGVG